MTKSGLKLYDGMLKNTFNESLGFKITSEKIIGVTTEARIIIANEMFDFESEKMPKDMRNCFLFKMENYSFDSLTRSHYELFSNSVKMTDAERIEKLEKWNVEEQEFITIFEGYDKFNYKVGNEISITMSQLIITNAEKEVLSVIENTIEKTSFTKINTLPFILGKITNASSYIKRIGINANPLFSNVEFVKIDLELKVAKDEFIEYSIIFNGFNILL